jgi:hypothetical protein
MDKTSMHIYKAGNLYQSWMERGPPGTKYSVSANGWFDTYNFEKFFFEIALPYLRRKEGKKMLIGDNLSSHISASVIEECNDVVSMFEVSSQKFEQYLGKGR